MYKVSSLGVRRHKFLKFLQNNFFLIIRFISNAQKHLSKCFTTHVRKMSTKKLFRWPSCHRTCITLYTVITKVSKRAFNNITQHLGDRKHITETLKIYMKRLTHILKSCVWSEADFWWIDDKDGVCIIWSKNWRHWNVYP